MSTRFRWLGPNDRIVVDGFDDPKVQGVACHISRAVTGGVKGGLGFAEDTSDASIACRQVGPIHINGELKDGESVFDERRSLVFKELHVVRFFDRQRNVLVYVSYSDRVLEGSPKNSISSVPVMGWTPRRRADAESGRLGRVCARASTFRRGCRFRGRARSSFLYGGRQARPPRGTRRIEP